MPDHVPSSTAGAAVCAVVVAAGSGDRFGGPKQYEALLGERVLDWALSAAVAACDHVVLVVAPERLGDAESVDRVVAGGRTRSESVRAGLAALPAEVEIVVVHDAARPLAGAPLWDAVIGAVRAGADAAVPAVPVVDTVKRVDRSVVTETVDRSDLVAVQTPQAFTADWLLRAHAGAGDATDDAALVEAIGGRVVVVPGDPRNRKLTTRDDLVMIRSLAVAGVSA